MGSYLLASAEEAWYNYVYQAAGSLELYSGTSRVSECVCVCAGTSLYRARTSSGRWCAS